MIIFDPAQWYWTVGDDASQVYSSASGAFVPSTDAAYTLWASQGNSSTTRVNNLPELVDVLSRNALRPTDPDVLAMYVGVVGILSQDLVAQFTATDYAALQVAISASAQFGLLWSSLLAQRDPMMVSNPRFMSGWNALVSVLGRPRMNEIAAAINAPPLVV